MRVYGAREVATGIAILASHDATSWIGGRVAGDAADIATVVAAGPKGSARQGRKLLTLATLIGATAADLFCAIGLTAEKGGPGQPSPTTTIAPASQKGKKARGVRRGIFRCRVMCGRRTRCGPSFSGLTPRTEPRRPRFRRQISRIEVRFRCGI